MANRIPISQLGISTGKKARLRPVLYQHRMSNGTGLSLPYDQGLGHRPRELYAIPPATDRATSSGLSWRAGLRRHLTRDTISIPRAVTARAGDVPALREAHHPQVRPARSNLREFRGIPHSN